MVNYCGQILDQPPVIQREQPSTLTKDSLIAIFVSALAWVGAEAFQRESPAFSATLRVVPLFAAGIWAIRRISPQGRHNVVHLQPAHHEYVVPAPIFTAPNNPQRNWFSGLFSNRNNHVGWFNNPVTHNYQPHVDPAPLWRPTLPSFSGMRDLASNGITNIRAASRNEFNGNPVPNYASNFGSGMQELGRNGISNIHAASRNEFNG
ncbi:MAG: hypothetical protein H0V82_09960 [Candidatus Protochlamydia sp.]|nr:hypothetical protein [Candidatus Protochlamydia sp.]